MQAVAALQKEYGIPRDLQPVWGGERRNRNSAHPPAWPRWRGAMARALRDPSLRRLALLPSLASFSGLFPVR